MAGKKLMIEVRGARVNNLKNINVDIPRNSLVVITGLSGSGKSSFAFDTLFAEANRRYMESLSSYARHFLEGSGKPDVDAIHNLSPAISIDQKSVSRSPRSTVGTMTEVYDYLRVLFSKAGTLHCPSCGRELSRRSAVEILEEILLFPDRSPIVFLARSSLCEGKSEKEALALVEEWGYARIRKNGALIPIAEAREQAGYEPASFDIVIDRLLLDVARPDKERILDSLLTAFRVGQGTFTLLFGEENEERIYNSEFRCDHCHLFFPECTPRHFSFNAPEGACPKCTGLGKTMEFDPDLVLPNKNLSLLEGAIRPWNKMNGERHIGGSAHELLLQAAKRNGFTLSIPIRKMTGKQLTVLLSGEKNGGESGFPGVLPLLERKFQESKSEHLRAELESFMVSYPCPACEGKRLRPESLGVTIAGQSIHDMSSRSVEQFLSELKTFRDAILGKGCDRRIVDPLFREMETRLRAVDKVGLGYLELSRGADTLSGGEAQRVRLSVQIKSGLSGILYVLDEPSVGLHSRDTDRLVNALLDLKAADNTVVVVEHDTTIMRRADYLIDFGPGAGREGGEVIFAGTPEKLLKSKVLTGQYLSGRRSISLKKKPRRGSGEKLSVLGAAEHNLKHIDVHIPLGMMVTVAGVSGSGKSSLVHDILARALSKKFYNAKAEPGAHRRIEGIEHLDKVISVTQDPIGRTPRSNAATYTGVFSHIRDVFADLPEAKKERFSPTHFSFNMKGGRCEVCQGGGMRKIEMHLLPDIYVPCEACGGTRYNAKTLTLEYRGMNISQVLRMNVSEARHFFLDQPAIEEKLRVLEEVGLGYLLLGQSATELSGGEAQRIKLATELARKSTGRTLYILDEPTIGLHFEDVRRLLEVLEALVDKGNTVLIVEHNTDVIRASDWVIELGPDGGARGGELVFAGPSEKLASHRKSLTGKYL